MLNSEWMKQTRKVRQEEKRLLSLGYKKHETDWEIHRGYRISEVIVDAKVSRDGKYVYTLLGNKEVTGDE